MDLQVFVMELLCFSHSVPRVLGVELEKISPRVMEGDRDLFAAETKPVKNRFRHHSVVGVGVTPEYPSYKGGVFPVLAGAVELGVGVDNAVVFVWSGVRSA